MTRLGASLIGFGVVAFVGCPNGSTSEPEPESVELDHGSFVLTRADEDQRLDFGAEQLVFCRWYAEPERGDYVWVRLAQDPGQDGDAGPRLDIDLCRVSEATSTASYAPMEAGAHGSHCAPEPGFAIWWHEGEDAFNSGPTPAAEGCELELDFDPQAMVMSGRFACAPLEQAEHAKTQTGAEPKPAPESVAVRDGSFRCRVERAPPPTTD